MRYLLQLLFWAQGIGIIFLNLMRLDGVITTAQFAGIALCLCALMILTLRKWVFCLSLWERAELFGQDYFRLLCNVRNSG